MRSLFRPLCTGLAASAATLVFCGRASAQCPTFGWDGAEPPEFTHYVDADGDGVCDRDGSGSLIVAWQSNGVHPNGYYPDCKIDGGHSQTNHGHWEFTRLQKEGGTGETEEKDYLDNQNPDMAGQTLRFLSREPARFDHALRPSANPSGRYWQVDEWIGPGTAQTGRIPLLTWTERFFACSHFDACGSIGGKPAYGAYWTNMLDGLAGPTFCGGDGREANPNPPRSAICGGGMTSCQ